MPHCLDIPNLRFFLWRHRRIWHLTSLNSGNQECTLLPTRPKNTNYLEICFPSQNSNSFAFTWSTESQLQKIDTKEKSLFFRFVWDCLGFFAKPASPVLPRTHQHAVWVSPTNSCRVGQQGEPTTHPRISSRCPLLPYTGFFAYTPGWNRLAATSKLFSCRGCRSFFLYMHILLSFASLHYLQLWWDMESLSGFVIKADRFPRGSSAGRDIQLFCFPTPFLLF